MILLFMSIIFIYDIDRICMLLKHLIFWCDSAPLLRITDEHVRLPDLCTLECSSLSYVHLIQSTNLYYRMSYDEYDTS